MIADNPYVGTNESALELGIYSFEKLLPYRSTSNPKIIQKDSFKIVFSFESGNQSSGQIRITEES